MAILKLKPSGKDYIWGGHNLITNFHKEYSGERLAETWELSCHPDGPSYIINGADAGKTLAEYVEEKGKAVLGTNCERFEDFPILIKFIDADDNLSVQVHPDNEYALREEGQYGKTEMWYVLDCQEGASLYYGFEQEITKEQMRSHIENNTLTEVLKQVPVTKGDVFFIEAGTIHAIGKGIVIAEIQQNSNVTYRVYDYGRIGADGKPRDLHIEKALQVTHTAPVPKGVSCAPHIASCEYFTVDKYNLDGDRMCRLEGRVDNSSFMSFLITEGKGTMKNGSDTIRLNKGDSVFLPAGSGLYVVEGCLEMLVTYVGGGKESVRVGIDLGGTNVKLGLVNQNQEIIASDSIPTLKERAPEEVVKDMADAVKKILADNGLTLADCEGVGVGSPGTIDPETGMVLFSNNIRWERVPLGAMLEEQLHLKVKVANDANCAALGEAKAGAAMGCDNVTLLTLGTGVGGGVLCDGKLLAAGELGHIILEKNGKLCTCGRKGCVEAYASATALIRDAKEAAANHPESSLNTLCGGDLQKMDAEIPFRAAQQGDKTAQELIHNYIEALGDLVTDVVNFYRPEKILLGGGVSAQGENLTRPVTEYVKKNAFSADYIKLPEIKIAALGNRAGIIGAANLVD